MPFSELFLNNQIDRASGMYAMQNKHNIQQQVAKLSSKNVMNLPKLLTHYVNE